jgi:uncharacterized protein YdeI (YjbR/CyaY-like superfamily)
VELYCTSRNEWREWLEKNHLTSDEIWLIYYKKPSGKPRIPYPDAVEEALCFGWIDGKIKRINDEYYVQKFTPRRSDSRWSKYNIERVKKLIKKGLMKPVGLRAYQKAIDCPELIYDNKADGDPEIPEDLLTAFKNCETGYTNFMNFSQSIRRIYIDWLNYAKRTETRHRRIEKIVRSSEKNIRPGMM